LIFSLSVYVDQHSQAVCVFSEWEGVFTGSWLVDGPEHDTTVASLFQMIEDFVVGIVTFPNSVITLGSWLKSHNKLVLWDELLPLIKNLLELIPFRAGIWCVNINWILVIEHDIGIADDVPEGGACFLDGVVDLDSLTVGVPCCESVWDVVVVPA